MEITKLRLSNSLSSERNDDAYGFSRERTPLKLALLEQLVDDDGGLDDSRSMRKPKKTNVAATKPCSTTTDVYTREYSIRGTRKNERERERDKERETGDALKCCLSEDVSYPRERALVNRRGRLGAVATISHPLLALIPQAIDCRLARLSVLYLNTWRICSPARCSLALCVRERKNRIHLQAFLPLESRDRFSWFSTFPSCLPRTILLEEEDSPFRAVATFLLPLPLPPLSHSILLGSECTIELRAG